MSLTVVLRTAFKVDSYRNKSNSPVATNEDRLDQYKRGLDSFLNLNSQLKCKILIVDNTIKNRNDFPKSILDLLFKTNLDISPVATNTNKFGRFNKGAGDMETYRHIIQKGILNSDYFLHFEPRLRLINNSFNLNFLSNPRNLFNKIPNMSGIQTGYMGLKTKDFFRFCTYKNILRITLKRIPIEYELENFAYINACEILSLENLTYRTDPITKSEKFY